ncbi:hypothetical protein E7Y31_07095, partial [Candidatus Frankia alpina]
MLHYLHRQGPGATLLTLALHGGRDHRDRAAELIAQGAPADDAQLAAYLTHVEERTLVGDWSSGQLQRMAGLTRHPPVRDHLLRLLEHPAVPREVKITVVGLLRGCSPDTHDRGVALLTGWMAEDQPVSVRCAAAGCLARFGASHHTRAAAALHALATDTTRGTNDRQRAAQALAQLGVEGRSLAADALFTRAAEPGRDPFDRLSAMRQLAGLGGDQRARAAEVAQALATTPAIPSRVRVQAATILADLGGEYRSRAADLLRALATDPAIEKSEQALALATAAAVSPELRAAATALQNQATD